MTGRLNFRSRRAPALIACLALFLAGSNYCVLSAWSGNVRMACLTVPAPAAANSSSEAPRCGHCAVPAPETSSDGTAGPSCCPAPVVTPSAPSIDKADAATQASPVLATLNPAQASPAAAALHTGLPTVFESPPPSRLHRAPLPARAPPLV